MPTSTVSSHTLAVLLMAAACPLHVHATRPNFVSLAQQLCCLGGYRVSGWLAAWHSNLYHTLAKITAGWCYWFTLEIAFGFLCLLRRD